MELVARQATIDNHRQYKNQIVAFMTYTLELYDTLQVIVVISKKASQNLHIPVSLFEVSHVAGILQRIPFDFIDQLEVGHYGQILAFIISAINEQRAHADLVNDFHGQPVFQIPSRNQFRWTIPITVSLGDTLRLMLRDQ